MRLLGTSEKPKTMRLMDEGANGSPLSDPTNPPDYLAKHLKEREEQARWLQGEIQVWEEREEAAKRALKELRAIEEQNQATIRQLNPSLPSKAEEDLMRDFEYNMEKLGEDENHG